MKKTKKKTNKQTKNNNKKKNKKKKKKKKNNCVHIIRLCEFHIIHFIHVTLSNNTMWYASRWLTLSRLYQSHGLDSCSRIGFV